MATHKSAKRTPGSSTENVVKAFQDISAGPLLPPAHVVLRDCDAPFWAGIVRARARSEWSELDLVIAAQLARCQADIEAESVKLDSEGSVVENARGTVVANARVAVLEQLARREMALLRTLRMGGRIAGDSRDEAGRRKAAADAESAASEIDADEDALLAGPTGSIQ